MNELNVLIESFDLNDSVKTQLIESFDKLVQKEVQKETIKLDEKAADYEKYVDKFLSEKSKEYEDLTEKYLNEKSEEYEDYVDRFLTEKSNEYENKFDYKELEEKLDSYLDVVVQEFVTEKTKLLENAVDGSKYDAIVEGFGSVLVAAGVEMAELTEAKKELSGENEIVENAERADALMEELIEVKKSNAEMLKLGLIKEASEDMTFIQKERFNKLANLSEFDAKKPQEFLNRLDTISEMVLSETTKQVKENTKKEVKKEIISESTKSSTDDRIKTVLAKSSHLF